MISQVTSKNANLYNRCLEPAVQNNRYTLPSHQYNLNSLKCIEKIVNFFKQIYQSISNCLFLKNGNTLNGQSIVSLDIIEKTRAVNANHTQLAKSLMHFVRKGSMSENQASLVNVIKNRISLVLKHTAPIHTIIASSGLSDEKKYKSSEYIHKQLHSYARTFKEALDRSDNHPIEMKKHLPKTLFNDYVAYQKSADDLVNHLIRL